WELLNQIITLLKPFNDTTTYFSRSNYDTLSIIYPLILALKFIFTSTKVEYNNSNNEQ
ncbi:2827_t:CDS:1, partial [Dentiscutata erythropus]